MHFFHSFWKNLHLTENSYTDMSVVSVTNKRYASDLVTLMAATFQILPWVARILAHKIALVASMVWSTRPLLLRKAYISDAHVTQMPIHLNG